MQNFLNNWNLYFISTSTYKFTKKMTIEQIEFESKEKLMIAIEKMLNKEDVYRTIPDKDNKPIKKKIISNGNLYLGGNFSIRLNIGNNGKVYWGIEYFGVSERINFHKNKDNNNKSNQSNEL